MELWIGYSKRATICHFCGEVIGRHEGVMQGRAKKRKGKPWPKVLRWHPACWLDSSTVYLDRISQDRVAVGKIGRPRVTDAAGDMLSDDARRERYLLIRRFNVLRYRRKKLEDQLVLSGVWCDKTFTKMLHITAKMRECAEEAKKSGGIPPRWKELLGLEVTDDKQWDSQDIVDGEVQDERVASVS